MRLTPNFLKRKRIALAYGFGRESRMLLEKLKSSNPLLIICIGKRKENNLELLNYEIKALRKTYIVKVLRIKGVNSTEGFREEWKFEEREGKIKIISYSNSILEYFSDRKKPFDILYVGRRKRDFKDRNLLDNERLPHKLKIKGVKFPLWNEEEQI